MNVPVPALCPRRGIRLSLFHPYKSLPPDGQVQRTRTQHSAGGWQAVSWALWPVAVMHDCRHCLRLQIIPRHEEMCDPEKSRCKVNANALATDVCIREP